MISVLYSRPYSNLATKPKVVLSSSQFEHLSLFGAVSALSYTFLYGVNFVAEKRSKTTSNAVHISNFLPLC